MTSPSARLDLGGRTYVVTGANSGIGLEVTRKLTAAGAHVVLAVRDVEKGRRAAADVGGRTSVRGLDLADLSSVREFAAQWDGPIAGLVNNAGIMMVAQGRTVDGFERQMGTNHFGHFALTNLLLPQVTDRVVTVSSGLHRGPQLDLDDLDSTSRYVPGRAYQKSKLANLLFTAELQRRLAGAGSPVRALACHPGYSATNLQSHHASPLAALGMKVLNRVVATSAEYGARPTFAALVEDYPGGAFVGPTGLGGMRGAIGLNKPSSAALDPVVGQRLWEISEERTGVRWPLG